ncbi:MAG: YceI family protein [bacterium]|nr:YceI family protein [bacterium]
MKKLFAVCTTICLVAGLFLNLACKKSPTPSEAPPSVPVAEGQKAQAVGTADTAPTEKCTYSTDPKTIKLEWTAYKFTDKTPVKGGFRTTAIQGFPSGDSLADLAKKLRMDIDGASIESGDPGRNVTVKDFFFNELNPPFKMAAVVKDLQGTDTQGNLMIEIDMNGVTKEVPFEYTATPEGAITAKGGINLMNWNLKKAFDSIHSACEELHTGPDGISKTWDVVDLQITGNFSKTCQ